MKRIAGLFVLLAVLAFVGVVVAQTYVSPSIKVDQFTPSGGMVFKEQVRESLVNIKTATDQLNADRAADLVGTFRVDTNAVPNTTTYTPFAPGALLYGSASNQLWVAVGATTNDWKEITMTAED